jgi:hypothetical protein
MNTLKTALLCLALNTITIISFSQNISYNSHFTGERLRLDIVFAGDHSSQNCFLEAMFREPAWGGSTNNLVEKFGYGEYNYRVEDKDGNILFSKGFNSLFQEWRTTPEAKITKRAMKGSYVIPFPKIAVNVIFSERSKEDGTFMDIASFTVDPTDKSISAGKTHNFDSYLLYEGGKHSQKVDLVFIAEGYTSEQMSKFREDSKRFAGYLFEMEPYKSRKSDFNIWIVESVSDESGTDIPHQDSWARTALSSSFYTFGIDRYLTAHDQSKIAAAASQVPYDALYVIVNTEKYGGGGIYNFYGLSMSDHKLSAEVFVHELGHSFAGLGDEYYSSEVAYEDFYDLNREPWEPNLTTKIDFRSKWEDLVEKGEAGLYEGGGYMAKGIFRPASDCRMKSNTAPGFCPVCTRAINTMIDYYIK